MASGFSRKDPSRRHPQPRGSDTRLDAVGVPVGVRHRVGSRPDQGIPEWRPRGHGRLQPDRQAAGAASGAVAGVRRAGAPSAGLPRLSRRGDGGGPRPHRRSRVSLDARRSRALQLQLAVGDGDGDPGRRPDDHPLPAHSGGPGAADRRRDVSPHARAAHDHRVHAVARIRHPIRRHRRDARPGVHANGRALSVLRGDARLARRGADRVGHELERAVRQPAEDHGASSSA